jgi:hypothetical protein
MNRIKMKVLSSDRYQVGDSVAVKWGEESITFRVKEILGWWTDKLGFYTTELMVEMEQIELGEYR